jgi:hypothetical protein
MAMIEKGDSLRPAFQIPLGQELTAVLPLGIPMGWLSPESRVERRFLIRRGRKYCSLDIEGHALWSSAWRGVARRRLAFLMAQRWIRRTDQVIADIDLLISRRMLLGLCGDWRDDWARICGVKPVPRGVVLGADEKHGRRLITPDLHFEISISGVDFAVWSTWDGSTTLDQSIQIARETTDTNTDVLRQHCHALLVACVRAAAIFIDDVVMPRGGE